MVLSRPFKAHLHDSASNEYFGSWDAGRAEFVARDRGERVAWTLANETGRPVRVTIEHPSGDVVAVFTVSPGSDPA